MFLAPNFLGGEPLNFWSGIIKFSQIPTMWQSFRAIGRGTSENAWRKKKTSAVKHKPVRNGGSGRPNEHGYKWSRSQYWTSNFLVLTQGHLQATLSKLLTTVCSGQLSLLTQRDGKWVDDGLQSEGQWGWLGQWYVCVLHHGSNCLQALHDPLQVSSLAHSNQLQLPRS